MKITGILLFSSTFFKMIIKFFLKNLVKGKGNEDEDFKVLNEFAKKKQEDATLSPEVLIAFFL